MADPTENHTKATELLALAKTYPHNSAARLATLTEAHVHATLYLADLTAAIAAPVRIQLGPEGVRAHEALIEKLANEPAPIFAADDHGTPPVPEVDAALKTPAKPRRTRKAPTAKDTEK
jgi:hypothetical protein